MKGESTTQALALTCQAQSCASNNRTKVVEGHRNSNKTIGVVRPWSEPNLLSYVAPKNNPVFFWGGRTGQKMSTYLFETVGQLTFLKDIIRCQLTFLKQLVAIICLELVAESLSELLLCMSCFSEHSLVFGGWWLLGGIFYWKPFFAPLNAPGIWYFKHPSGFSRLYEAICTQPSWGHRR